MRSRAYAVGVRVARNVAIILLLALVVAAVPGGGNLARGLVAAMTIAFLVIIGFSGYVLYRQNRLAYVSLPEPLRALLVGALGAIALMVAGTDELLETGRRDDRLALRARRLGLRDRPRLPGVALDLAADARGASASRTTRRGSARDPAHWRTHPRARPRLASPACPPRPIEPPARRRSSSSRSSRSR